MIKFITLITLITTVSMSTYAKELCREYYTDNLMVNCDLIAKKIKRNPGVRSRYVIYKKGSFSLFRKWNIARLDYVSHKRGLLSLTTTNHSELAKTSTDQKRVHIYDIYNNDLGGEGLIFDPYNQGEDFMGVRLLLDLSHNDIGFSVYCFTDTNKMKEPLCLGDMVQYKGITRQVKSVYSNGKVHVTVELDLEVQLTNKSNYYFDKKGRTYSIRVLDAKDAIKI